MKTLKLYWVSSVLAVVCVVAFGQVPTKINYQGRLLNGTNLFSGTTNIVTALYTASSGGTAIYAETNSNVGVLDGLYSLFIGDEATGLGNALTNSAVYLELTVGTQTLTPREQLASGAYALLAGGVQSTGVTAGMIAPGAVGSSQIADGSVSNADLAANAVTAAKIQDGTIMDIEINAAAGIDPNKILNIGLTRANAFSGDVSGAYNNLRIGNNTVISAMLVDGTVSNADLAANSVDSTKIVDLSVALNDLANASVDSSKIVDGTVALADLAPNSVNASKIVDGTVAVNDLDTTSVDTRYLKLAGGTLTGALTNYIGFYGNGIGITNLPAGAYTETDPFWRSVSNLFLLTSVWVRADSTTNYVRRTGDTMSGNLNMGGNVITNAIFRGNGAGLTNLNLRVALNDVIWVATNGTPAGPGTADRPYDTPQNGYNAALAGGAVVIASGVYPGGLTMNRPDVHVVGLGRPVIQGALVYNTTATRGKVRIEDLMIMNGATIAGGSNLKLFNVRIENGTTIQPSSMNIEFQCCFLNDATDGQPYALWIQANCSWIGVNHTAIRAAGDSALVIATPVVHLEVLGCEIANTSGANPTVDDQQGGATAPQHHYAYNHIRNAMEGSLAVRTAGSGTISFFHNTVEGSLGPAGINEYYGLNVVVGVPNWGFAEVPVIDAAGNARYALPTMPTPWND
jgi:hypothetical protein